MLEPLQQVGQWAWQQAAVRANTMMPRPREQTADMTRVQEPSWPLDSPDVPSFAKGFKPLLPEKSPLFAALDPFRRRLGRWKKRLQEVWRTKQRPSSFQAQPGQTSGFRPRQQVLKDFPYNELGKLPRFSLLPEEVSASPVAEKLQQLEQAQVFSMGWDDQHLFNPFLEH